MTATTNPKDTTTAFLLLFSLLFLNPKNVATFFKHVPEHWFSCKKKNKNLTSTLIPFMRKTQNPPKIITKGEHIMLAYNATTNTHTTMQNVLIML